MLIFVALFLIQACFAGTIPGTPENITVTFLAPSSVRVSWQISVNPIEKYLVTYKPTDDRVVQQVAGNSEAVILERLRANTQYSIVITAFWNGKKYRSRQIVFRTLDSPSKFGNQEPIMQPGHHMGIFTDDVFPILNNATNSTTRELPPIRGVEIGIVLLVLMVWAGAIALFFNRWGKIRMLLPYQPDYKHEQLKVPGTGVCTGGACSGQHSHQFDGSDIGPITSPIKIKLRHFHYLQEEPSVTIAERCTRSRINSAIFVSSEGKGFDSIEFLRRHGSQSVLCRKARSAENISEDNRKRQFTDNRKWYTDDGSGSNKNNNLLSSHYNNYTHRQSLPYHSENIEMAECHAMPKKQFSDDSNWAKFQTVTTTTTIPITTTSINNCNNNNVNINNNNNNNTNNNNINNSNNINQTKNLIGSQISTKIIKTPLTTLNHINAIGSTNIGAVTSSNSIIVGSISIEKTPDHILLQEKLEQQEAAYNKLQQQEKQKRCFHKQDSIITSQPKLLNKSSSSTTTTASSSSGHSQSPLVSPNSSPVMINIKHNNNKTIPQLPTLSISEPSPPHDGDFL